MWLESAGGGLRAEPVALDAAVRLSPDLVLVAALPTPEDPAFRALTGSGARVVEFAPHDFEDVAALLRGVGAEVAGGPASIAFERRLSRPLAHVGGSSHGMLRPRVAALVSVDPLILAGGHSFLTDLIEIAGGRSVTHPGEENRLPLAADAWGALEPDLILVVGPVPPDVAVQEGIRNALPRRARVEFFAFPGPEFWLEAPLEPALRLRALILRLSKELEAQG